MGTVVIHAEKIMVIGDLKDCMMVYHFKGQASEFYRGVVIRCPQKHHELYRIALEAKDAIGPEEVHKFLDYLSGEGHHYVKVWRPYQCEFMITYQAPDEDEYRCFNEYLIMNVDDTADAAIVQRAFDGFKLLLASLNITPDAIFNKLYGMSLISGAVVTTDIK